MKRSAQEKVVRDCYWRDDMKTCGVETSVGHGETQRRQESELRITAKRKKRRR